MKDPVNGTAQVVGSTQPPDHASSANVNLNLVVQAEGVPATPVELDCMAPIKKWPFPGTTLPVTVDRDDPTKVKILWDDIPESGDVASQQAAALAAQLNEGGGAGQGVPGGGDMNQIVEALQQAMPGAQVNVEGAAGTAPAPASSEADRVAQLEKLAKLKDSGALTDQEFAREKARILGQ
jgi:hypothetical protein